MSIRYSIVVKTMKIRNRICAQKMPLNFHILLKARWQAFVVLTLSLIFLWQMRFLGLSAQKHGVNKANNGSENLGNWQSNFWTYSAWFGATAFVTASVIYLLELFVPDARVLQDSKHYYSTWKLRVYCSLPLNAMSRLSGGLANTYIPVWLRPTLLGMFVRTYNCRMDEALIEDLREYPTLASFFNRKLRPSVRPISDAELVSPADGIVVHYGKVENERIEFVKGQDYALSDFLGPVNLNEKLENLKKGSAELYQVVIYLAPGDYHAFHSPARWTMQQEVHYPGLLLSVRPTLLDRLPRLFCMNERVVLNGHWRHGFFSLCAVAATNVGDVAIDIDPQLHTNLKRIQRKVQNPAVASCTEFNHTYFAGERIGEFRLGSTIVLVFESPKTIEFAFKAGDHLRYGQSLIKTDL